MSRCLSIPAVLPVPGSGSTRPRLAATLLVLTLAACATPRIAAPPAAPAPPAGERPGSGQAEGTKPKGGYYMDDGPADVIPPALAAVPDAVPRDEPLHPRANQPYMVMGSQYVPEVAARPYKMRGMASWYGRKFHGQRTSSGELYDMYKMTAAHPTLPIPSYARVTNLRNNRSVVVRVNDRGPFLHGRLMDLSYTAALKLGFVQQGSAWVEVERLLPGQVPAAASAESARPVATDAAADRSPIGAAAAATLPTGASTAQEGIWLQLGAFTAADKAEGLRMQVAPRLEALRGELRVQMRDGTWRLRFGPYPSNDVAVTAAQEVRRLTGVSPIVAQ